jgi:hypothetical protein
MNRIKIPFSTLLQSLVRSGALAEMKGNEVSLLLALNYEMERLSKPTLVLTNGDLNRLTGLSPQGVRIAREKLMERGFVSLGRIARGAYQYSLLVPTTKRRMAEIPGKRLTNRPRRSRLDTSISTPSAPRNNLRSAPLEFRGAVKFRILH